MNPVFLSDGVHVLRFQGARRKRDGIARAALQCFGVQALRVRDARRAGDVITRSRQAFIPVFWKNAAVDALVSRVLAEPAMAFPGVVER